jgi:hypothetical protein
VARRKPGEHQRDPSGLPRKCRVQHDGQRCRYDQLVMPGGARSPYCYWDRLSRTSMDAQIREAERRLAAAAGEPFRARVAPAEWPDGERWCAGCQSFVPLWYAAVSRCKACHAKGARDSHRMSVYGLSPAGHKKLAETQDDRCAICRKRQTMKSVAVDHDHKTGVVRGLLCKRCNHDLLGAAFESVKILLAAATYLVVPPSGGDWIDPEVYGDAVLRAFLATVDEQSRRQAAERRAASAGKTAVRAEQRRS